MATSTYRFPEQLRLKHLNVGDCFRFESDWLTPPWTKRDGTPGEQSLVYSKEQTYQLVSPRKIRPVKALVKASGVTFVTATGAAMGLGKGESQLGVKTGAFIYEVG